MFSKLIAALIALVLVFGGAAATAYAAQDSLPSDALYPVKTLGESVALGLSVNSAEKLEKALGQAQRRVDEIAELSMLGVGIPEQVGRDYTERVEFAMRLAARMSDDQMSQALEKIQESFQKQLAAVEQLRAARPDDVQLAGVESQLRQHLGLVALGLSDPQAFREQLAAMLQGIGGPSSTQDPNVTEEPSSTETPEPEDDNSNDGNTNDGNSNDDNGNTNDSNANDDDGNVNDDDGNINDDDGNGNDDDGNMNDDDGNANDDDDGDDDDEGNGNDDDDGNVNDDEGNGNDDDDGNVNDDDGNFNDNGSDGNFNDNGSNGNGDDNVSGRGVSGLSMSDFLVIVARLGGFPLTD